MTGPKPPPKRCLHIVRSRASSLKWEYPLLSLRSSSSFLRLLPPLLATSISPFYRNIQPTKIIPLTTNFFAIRSGMTQTNKQTNIDWVCKQKWRREILVGLHGRNKMGSKKSLEFDPSWIVLPGTKYYLRVSNEGWVRRDGAYVSGRGDRMHIENFSLSNWRE